MESHNQQQLTNLRLSDDDGKRDWASLPLDLLKICLGAPSLDPATKRAALASCKAFSRALLRTSSHNLALFVDRRSPFVCTTQIWQELWGEPAEQPRQGQHVVIHLLSGSHGSPGRCWDELLAANQRLPFVRELFLTVRGARVHAANKAKGMGAHARCSPVLHRRPARCPQRLSLDVLVPQGVSALLPNLQVLGLAQCSLTPAAMTTLLDAGCGRLHYLQVMDLSVQPRGAAGTASQPPPSLQQLATAQLRQLAKLPSLTTVTLDDDSCPTLFLVALGTQLTSLQLDESYRQCLPDTDTPTPAWRSTLQHVARCTRLQELRIPCCTAEELGLVAPALQQLRSLVCSYSSAVEADGDAVLDLLLGLPHLTRLECSNLCAHKLRRSHLERPCRWEHLTVSLASPQLLARLPLHSLKQPVQWTCLAVRDGTPLLEVRAAVANVTRRCPAGFRWEAQRNSLPRLSFPVDHDQGTEVDIPAVLRVVRPLLVALPAVEIRAVDWDVARVRGLGEALPRTCTRLMLGLGSISENALEQVARSLPWVRWLELREQEVSPGDVVEFVCLARRLKQQEGGAGEVRLEEVVVEKPLCPGSVSEAKHKQRWERAAQRLEGGRVVLKVVWG